jgi:TetR/AcrR family transcriptional regulator
MTDETEQKILDAALKEFAEKGYKGATTRVIADKAGFTEMTLFRKFETKENLFYRVIAQNHEKMRREFELVLVDKKFENPRDFLETLIKNLAKIMEDNFETFDLTSQDRGEKFEPVMAGFVKRLAEYLEKNIPNSEIDYETFVWRYLRKIHR